MLLQSENGLVLYRGMLFFCKRHSPVAFKHCWKGFSWQVMQYGAPLFPRKWRSVVKVVHWTENKGLLVTWSPDQTANLLQIINGHRFRKWSHNRAGSEKRRRRPNKVWRSIKWIQRKLQDRADSENWWSPDRSADHCSQSLWAFRSGARSAEILQFAQSSV